MPTRKHSPETLALAAAFMSHTSTFAILGVIAVLTAMVFAWRGGPALRSPAVAVAAATAAALVASIAIYYGHFLPTYQSELARIGTETAAAAPDAGGRGIGARLGSVPRYLHEYIGLPALALAAAGAWWMYLRRTRDRLTLTLAAWTTSCVLFLTIGILTPVDMRYYLASMPVVAIAASAGASALWARGRYHRLIGGALLIWVVWIGIATWWRTW